MENKLIRYKMALSQIKAVTEGEEDLLANMANVSAIIKETFDFHWVGFYLVKGNELVLGPFQGPVACTRIKFGKGVCGCSWERKETIIVDDVDKFSGHIACSPLSKSEIVVPIVVNGEVIAVLDIDSEKYGDFDGEDRNFLEEISGIIVKKEKTYKKDKHSKNM
jgi:GAF domain-containing protein